MILFFDCFFVYFTKVVQKEKKALVRKGESSVLCTSPLDTHLTNRSNNGCFLRTLAF